MQKTLWDSLSESVNPSIETEGRTYQRKRGDKGLAEDHRWEIIHLERIKRSALSVDECNYLAFPRDCSRSLFCTFLFWICDTDYHGRNDHHECNWTTPMILCRECLMKEISVIVVIVTNLTFGNWFKYLLNHSTSRIGVPQVQLVQLHCNVKTI